LVAQQGSHYMVALGYILWTVQNNNMNNIKGEEHV
jgi:hypothetical protein